ncbi:DASH family cryptochrome [Fodinibius sp.]|uniref:DASH family cryptochrome n=1 Tax=Fodinibius sp. TaxID=1872440 RepID=UPI002ACD5F35|nr:DASH family cryptochrome [Fodinibius sp.]MDZ7659557.1 DASH family cryptochrome [Fodinibius sp.]
MATAIVWFRNNLRLHDNEALHRASKYDTVIPIYVFDPHWFGETTFGFPKTGSHRARFLLETLQNLRNNLRNLGSDLIVRQGKTHNILAELASAYEASIIFTEKEVTSEELAIEEAVEKHVNAEVEYTNGRMLFHPDDIPCKPGSIPKVFTNFRKQLEKNSSVRQQFPTPEVLPEIAVDEPGDLPSIEEFGLSIPPSEDRAVLPFNGGEDEALKRLKQYFWEKDQLKNYKFTRNGLLGSDYSSKFSPWLANGSLSPRRIYWEVKKYEEERKKNVSTYWMIFELIWRDFFRYSAMKYGNAIFKQGGIQQKDRNWRHDEDDFRRWAEGQTGIPFIDANMRELNKTGYMSNRGRQNVASFLAQNLNIDWRMGAEYFESKLIDYDVCSNYGNWMYNSTVGQDPRNRYFNIPNQADKYDKKGEYVRHWLPELSDVPVEFVHEPHRMALEQQKLAGVEIGKDYPEPMIDLESSYEEIRNRD